MKELIENLKKGVEVGEGRVLRAKSKKGRFAEETNLDIYIVESDSARLLLHAKLFAGRGLYRDWIELFGLSREIFETELEDKILDIFSPHTGRLFVEYFEDLETAEELKKGVPPALSRLGFKLARRGFTYVRDWYIPEGLMEGGHKLQGEKAANEEIRERRFNKLKEELEGFMEKSVDEELKKKVLERFKILQSVWKRGSS